MNVPALELSGLKKNFGKAEIIRGIDLTIGRAERHAIIGPNGAGKSTLFNLITARFAPSAGTVKLHGEDLSGLQPFQINRKGLSRSFQITNIFPGMSVFENVRCALLWSQGYRYSFWHLVARKRDLTEGADAILEQINLTARRDLPAGTLSYAEQRALEIGITIAGGADVIMLDEPTAGMSNTETDYITDLILRVTEGKTLIMVEHDMSVVFGLADRISVLVYGEIIATGAPEDVRADPKVQEAYLGAALEAEH
ncbi:ABC transporter ATP-binding protein [Sulfitobacter sp. S190]|uniref:ABC transporter ATP-binding protein n=1 Tax=Sulfitobacter sp. S190 TaxID=2867022 RepID=UPI0021A44F8D|nr:ABC transporter ATP-binding protein [Sulfitobacter sp. S190]UWR24321.1 ABC transporter ATP-binding protein [Sulfitobacter sp. S190]